MEREVDAVQVNKKARIKIEKKKRNEKEAIHLDRASLICNEPRDRWDSYPHSRLKEPTYIARKTPFSCGMHRVIPGGHDSSILRVPNRLGGMRDLAFFCRDIRDLGWKQEWEAGITITSGSGIS